jgi:ligand-binding sensor domain-containing protein
VRHVAQAPSRQALRLQLSNEVAPDVNPAELVWSHAKRTGVARNPLKKDEKLKDRVDQQLQDIAVNSTLVRAFFKHPSVACISDL